MGPSVLLLLLSLFLFPVSVYCATLGTINRRPQPLVVAGHWDVVGLLFGCSGFLLATGPAMLHGFYHGDPRSALIRSSTRDAWQFWQSLDWLIWLAYYSLVATIVGLLFWWRRHTTAIYNIEPRALDEVLTQVFERRGQLWRREGERIYLAPAGSAQPHATSGIPALHILDVETFAAFRHATLHWTPEAGAARQEIEQDLERALESVTSPENPAASWLTLVAGFLFGAMAVCALAVIVIAIIVSLR